MEIGSKKQEFWLTLAILFPDIWVEGSKCKKCKVVSQVYNPSNSKTCKNLTETNEYEDENKMLILKGIKYEDNIVIEDLEFRSVISVAHKFVDPLNLAEDGILGLGDNEKSIVYEMYNKSYISNPIYSLFIDEIKGSYLYLDNINFTDLGLILEDTVTIPIDDEIIGNFSYNGTIYDAAPIEFTSISSYIIGPFSLLQNLYVDLVMEYGCYYFEEFIVCDCGGSYPDLEFIIGDKTLVITQGYYLMQVEKACFLFTSLGDKSWILGEPLLKEYFTTVNLREKTISFNKVSYIPDSTPTLFETLEGWIVVLGSILGSLIIYILAAGIYQIIKRRIDAQCSEPLLDKSRDSNASRF